MDANKKSIKGVLTDERRDVQERMFLLQQVLLAGSMLVLLTVGALLGGNQDEALALAAAVVGCLAIGGLTLKFRRVQLFGTICALMMICVELPYSFFANGGMRGGTPIWFVMCTLCISQIITGRKKWVLLAGEVVCVMLCYGLAYLHEDWIAPHTRPQSYWDSLLSVLLVCTAVCAIVGFEVYLLRTAVRRAEEERSATERLVKAQGRFFSNMSHEIRTPVNAIISLNEMILREEIPPEVEEDANNVRVESRRLLSVINDILDISKIESGSMEIVSAVYDTGDMLSDLVGAYWAQARDKGLELKIDIDPEMPARLIGDELRIRQILSNLLGNAVKYTAEGSVKLNVQPKAEDGKFSVVYSVTDTGAGIKKESIPDLFSAFRREDDSPDKISGTGLGLAIVKQLADLMGGTVSVNSVYTRGSTFVVEIPQKRVGEAHISAESIERRRNIGERSFGRLFEAPDAHVLAVDDNRTNLMVIGKLLRSTGVEVDTAESGAEALKLTSEKQYHLIFMDHMMPVMDGLECLRLIRSQTGGLCREARAVALTTNTGGDSRAFYAAAGFDGYLIKPIDSLALETECARLLPPELVTINRTGDDEDESGLQLQRHRARESVCITTNSVADLPRELIERYHIGVIPCVVSTAGGVFRDGEELDADGLIAYMDHSEYFAFSQPPPKEEYELFFADALQRANNVVHIAMSGDILTSELPFAREAAESFENVTVVDSRSVSGGLGLLAIEAAACAQRGDAPELIAERMKELRERIHCSFVVDSLDYLTRTKQVRPIFYSLTETLMVHPVMHLRQGRIRLHSFLFGAREMVWRKYIRGELRGKRNIDTRRLLVVYTGLSAENLKFIRREVEKTVKFGEIYFQKAAPSITANCGKNTMGLFFLENSEQTE